MGTTAASAAWCGGPWRTPAGLKIRLWSWEAPRGRRLWPLSPEKYTAGSEKIANNSRSGQPRALQAFPLQVDLRQFHGKGLEFQCLGTIDALSKRPPLALDTDCQRCYHTGADLEVLPKRGRPRKIYLADNGCLWHCRSALADVELSHRHFESVAVSPTAHLYN